MRYIIIDTYNLFFRMRHTASRHASATDRVGMCLHTMILSANKVVSRFDVDHVVFALEGGQNWRKEFYTPYKKPREAARLARTEDEAEEDELYFEVLNDFIEYIDKYTNCSVIKAKRTEADDVIGRWVHIHEDDTTIILSSDSDYYQLLSDKVMQYNGVSNELITIDGVFNDKDKPIIDTKTKEPKMIGDPQWLLFEKCIRGDKSDNVFSAYPGVRTKGTKNKTGLLEAFADRTKKGFAWNNLMLQKWVDHNDDEHKVLDDYERNKTLIDLSQMPDEIKDIVDEAIVNVILADTIKRIPHTQINFQFMKFCARHDLARIAQYPEAVIKWIIKPYKGILVDG